MARVVRGQLKQLKNEGYVWPLMHLVPARRVLFKHLLPIRLGPILVTLTLTIPSAIFTEAFLSYFGLRVQAPIASLGALASDGLAAIAYYPWRLLIPTGLISCTMLAFNILGDAIIEKSAIKQ